MGLDFTTVASSALGTIGTNIKEQATRKVALNDEIFKDIYGKVGDATAASEQQLVNAEQVIRTGIAIGLITPQELDSWLATSPERRKKLQENYDNYVSTHTVKEGEEMPSAIDLLMPPSYKRPDNFSPVAEAGIRQIAERYVGIFDASTVSPQEEKTFSENFQDQMAISLGLQNPRQSAYKRVAAITGRNVAQLEKILYPSQRTPFEVRGGMLAFRMPVNVQAKIAIQAATLALKQAQDKNANIEDVAFYQKHFQKRNARGLWEDDPTIQHINIFGLKVARGTKLSQLTDHLTLGTTLASIYESLGVDAPTSADHQRFRNDYMKIWGGITGQTLEDGISGVRFADAQTILAAYGRTGAGLDSLLFGQIRDPRNPNPAQNKINQGHTADQTIMFGISAYTNWADITKKANSRADTSFDAFLKVAQTGGLDAKGVNVNILGADSIPADMLNKMKLWADGGTALKDQFNNSLLPAYEDRTGYDGYLQTLNDEIQRRATAQNIKIDPQTNYNNAVLIIHQLENRVYGQSTQSGGYTGKFPINPTSAAPEVPASNNVVTEVSTDENTNIPVTKRGDASQDIKDWTETIYDEIDKEVRKGIFSGKDIEGNSVDIESMSKKQQLDYELRWYAHVAADRDIDLYDLYPLPSYLVDEVRQTDLVSDEKIVGSGGKRGPPVLPLKWIGGVRTKTTVEEPFDSREWTRGSITEDDRDEFTSFLQSPDNAEKVTDLRDRYTEKWDASGGADGPLADYPPYKFLKFVKDNTDFTGSVSDFYNTFLAGEAAAGPEDEQISSEEEYEKSMYEYTPKQIAEQQVQSRANKRERELNNIFSQIAKRTSTRDIYSIAGKKKQRQRLEILSKLREDLDVGRDLKPEEQEIYNAIIENPIEYIDSLTKNGLGSKKKVTRISDAEMSELQSTVKEAEEYKRQLLALKRAGNKDEYRDLENAILDKFGSSKEFMRRIGISVS